MAMAASALTLPVSCSFPVSAARASECATSRVQLRASAFPSTRKVVGVENLRVVSVWSVLGGCSSSSSSSSGRVSRRWQAVAEQLQTETEEGSEEAPSTDNISFFFEAEGTLQEPAVAKLATSLESVEGVSAVDITAAPDGTATVRLTKTMNVQATGVASGLVEVLLKAGFKLQALNLGFDEDGEGDEDFYDYDVSSSAEEEEGASAEA